MGRLRESLQTLCRSANPLGKIVDYIHEDMDGMQTEYARWHAEAAAHAAVLGDEAAYVDCSQSVYVCVG